MSKCQGCPVIGPCWAEERHRSRICDLVTSGRRDYAELVVKRSVGYDPPPDPRRELTGAARWLAPLRNPDLGISNHLVHAWEGGDQSKPWEYAATVAIVHLDTPDLLRVVVDLWRAQTERVRFVVVDAGSHDLAPLWELESPDLELILLRPRGWRATSQPVAAAMDCAFAVAQTQYVIGTHVDVFPRERDLARYLLSQCSADVPVVGWRMSPRHRWPGDLWRQMPSHTCTAYHMPTMRKLSARWDMLAAFDRLGVEPHQPHATGWPDTEVNLGMQLIDAGFQPWNLGEPRPAGKVWLCLGDEPNTPYSTRWFDHVRSFTGSRLFRAEEDRPALMARTVEEANARLEAWRAQPSAKEVIDLGRRIRACPDRECKGCGRARCRRLNRTVTREDCKACEFLPAAQEKTAPV